MSEVEKRRYLREISESLEALVRLTNQLNDNLTNIYWHMTMSKDGDGSALSEDMILDPAGPGAGHTIPVIDVVRASERTPEPEPIGEPHEHPNGDEDEEDDEDEEKDEPAPEAARTAVRPPSR